jgi:PAS domain S-box-containing protein
MAVKLNAGETMRDRERVALVILDQISQFTALLDTDGRVLEVNRAALERGGLDREKVLGRPFWEEGWWGSGQDDAARLRTAIGAAAAGEGVHRNLTMVDAGGSGEIEFSLTPVKDDSGRVEYVLVEGRNIAPTEHARAEPTPEPEEPPYGVRRPDDRAQRRGAEVARSVETLTEGEIRNESGRATPWVGATTDDDDLKRVQEALRGQARWLETVLESVSDGLIATGADGHIRLINSAAQALTGWRMGEAVGLPLDEVFHIVDESTRWPLECPGVTVLREGRVAELANHAVLLARDGTERPITDGAAPIRDEDGSILGGVLCFHDVSLRRQAELAVARLAAIVESSDDAIIGEDLDGHIISWNEGALRIYGYTQEEVIGHSIALLVPSDRLDEIASLTTPLSRGERVSNLETLRLRKDGSAVDVSIAVSPIRDLHGQLMGVSEIARDISERKRVEAAHRAREEQLRMALEAAHMGAWDHDLSTDRITLTVSDKSLFGDEPGTYKWEDLRRRIHPQDLEPMLREVDRLRRERAPYSRELRFVLPDASIRWVLCQGLFICNETGDAVRLVGVTMDITERKRAAELLKAREDQLRLALEAAHMSAWDHDLSTDRITLSVSDKSLFGDEPGTYKYEELNKRIHPEDREEYVRARREQVPISREARFVLPDGSIRWVWTQGRFIRNDRGEAVRALGVTIDITERKRAEDALRHYATRLASLHDIDRAILAIQPPEKIARVALRHLAKLVPCWRASVARIDPGAKEGRVLTSIGALSRRTAHGTKGTLAVLEPEDLETLKRGQSKIVDDLHKLTSLSEQLKLLRDAGARSVARLPLLVRGRLIGSINLYSDRPDAYTAENVELIGEAADQVAIALHNARLYDENRLARERLEVLSRRLIRAQEDERRQIARELHDEIGQALTAVKVNLQSVKNRAAGLDDRVAECIAIVDDTLGRVRGMALDLRPSLLDDLGLVAALQWYVEGHARRTGMAGRFIADPEKLRAAPEIETACFRLVQEALTNIARHSGATRFSVELLQHNGGLELIVRDDGCGFDPALALKRARGGASLGLVGMIERIELVGGKVAFVSAPGKGTEVQASIPRIIPGSPAEQHPGSSL